MRLRALWLALLLALLVGLAIGTWLRLRLERPESYLGSTIPAEPLHVRDSRAVVLDARFPPVRHAPVKCRSGRNDAQLFTGPAAILARRKRGVPGTKRVWGVDSTVLKTVCYNEHRKSSEIAYPFYSVGETQAAACGLAPE